jgi:membrane associated rhomboid family serine protease
MTRLVTPWVLRLIVVNVVVFLAELVVPGLQQSLAFLPAALFIRPWTLITYMFVHANWLHIVFNMLALFWFGPRVEERLGGRSFLTLYFVSGIAGGLLSLAFPSTRFVPIVGASGAIMGVGVAYARFWPRARFYLYGAVPVEAWLLILIYVALDLGGTIGIGGAGIAHFAHLGGAVAGYLYLTVHSWLSPARQWRRQVASPPTPRVFGDGDQLRRWREIRLDDLHPINRDEIVRLLKKVEQTGARSLTPEERATLDRFAGAA